MTTSSVSTPIEPDDDLPPQPGSRLSGPKNWAFVGRPRWLASHLFAVTVIVSFVALGFWQLDRLDERRTQNATIEARSFAAAITLDRAFDGSTTEAELDYVVVADTGRFLVPEVVRVANRSQGGAAGDWIVGLFETDGGRLILVNRGFLARSTEAAPPTDGTIEGWLRATRIREGSFAAADTGELGTGDEVVRVPRLDVDAIADRLVASGIDVDRLEPLWLQLADPDPGGAPELGVAGEPAVPEPVPLPPIDEGSHFSYAMQWFLFAMMGAGVYGLILLRKAAEDPRLVAPEAPTTS